MVENRNNLNSNTMTKAGQFKIVRKPEVMIPTIVL